MVLWQFFQINSSPICITFAKLNVYQMCHVYGMFSSGLFGKTGNLGKAEYALKQIELWASLNVHL